MGGKGFSALQRAENSSMSLSRRARLSCPAFQCSSASRKFLNVSDLCSGLCVEGVSVLFSEPKIPQWNAWRDALGGFYVFQCSSASRKFLNRTGRPAVRTRSGRFSALQRAENSSIIVPEQLRVRPAGVSVLFSEPKIPQFVWLSLAALAALVSVLFSEPKIPQSSWRSHTSCCALSFQCSSASRKFLNRARPRARACPASVSVLFSEPKIPQ